MPPQNSCSHFGPFLGHEPSLRQLSRNRILNSTPNDAICIDGTGSAPYDRYFSALLRLLANERVNGRNLVKSMSIVALVRSCLVDRFNCHAALRSFPDINNLRISNIQCSVDELRSLILSFAHLTSLELEGVTFDHQEVSTWPDGREEQYSTITQLSITLDAGTVSVLDLCLLPSFLRARQLRYLEIKGSSKISGTMDIMHRICALSQVTSSLTIGHISFVPAFDIAGLSELNLTVALAFNYDYILAVDRSVQNPPSCERVTKAEDHARGFLGRRSIRHRQRENDERLERLGLCFVQSKPQPAQVYS
ncbi:uncharacterized protein ARMOST_21206 [Armillaria ostoyae]|uniref:F-box domain-containing protein n=1 Tax=Armillaria ostoyae TaxID=47428 RepID=A0A284S9H8_ARMOS|nr:uncharacterized protein ARMOST_21206 [Armillaria ostoyae]